MTKHDWKVDPASGCGAYVSGIDLARLNDEEALALRALLFKHGALFFRDQNIAPKDHIRLAEQFAPIDVNRYFPKADGYDQIAKVEKVPGQNDNIGGAWHTDHSYDREPALGSILVARELPPQGGDTLFADMAKAYDTLDEKTKQEISTLKAIHGSEHVFGKEGVYTNSDQASLAADETAELPETAHPVVIRHPGSGRPILYVNPSFTLRIEGQSPEQSRPLLEKLYVHAIKEENWHRFQWTPGSVAMWDNRATWHFALNDYQGHYRLMHRITMTGVPLEAYSASQT